jgi:hypothetical protein
MSRKFNRAVTEKGKEESIERAKEKRRRKLARGLGFSRKGEGMG